MADRVATPHIAVRGAAEPPLDGLDVDLPLGRLIAFAGPAGSGAHTLAFQVLLAESRRQYVQALSPFEREYVGGARGGLALESVAGLPPAAVLPGPMPDAAQLSSYLHLDAPVAQILRRHGRIECPDCGGTCRSRSADEGAQWALTAAEGARGIVVAPVELGGSASPQAVAAELRRAGFLRLRIDGEVVRLQDDAGADLPDGAAAAAQLEVVVDRLALSQQNLTRLTEALRNARAMARGRAAVYVDGQSAPLWINQQLTCEACGRIDRDLSEADLAPGADRSVSVDGHTAGQLQALTLEGALDFWSGFLATHAGEPTAGGAADAILSPLQACCQVGLGYLHSSQPLGRLSTGEQLLLSLAAASSRNLSGILYLLSEAVEILDAEVRFRAVERLRTLTAAGNTVVLISGEGETLAACDQALHFAEGQCAAPGPPPQIEPAPPPGRRDASDERLFSLRGDAGHGGLGELDLSLPLGCLVAFTGPTGAGKSALLQEVLPSCVGSKGRGPRRQKASIRVEDGGLRRLVALGRSRVSEDASILDHLGLATHLARVYAETPAAAERGYPAEWFLLDRPGGRCTTCEGRGVLRWDLEYMESLSVPCPACEGRRYRPDVLEITQRGLAISDVLELSLEQAAARFGRHRRLGPPLEAAVRLALGHRAVGDAVGRLDPAELLRLSLAAALPRAGDRDLFTLRYPAAGQHGSDIAHLLRGIGDLVAAGASVWVEDRDPALLDAASVVVEMGPGRGGRGVVVRVTDRADRDSR